MTIQEKTIEYEVSGAVYEALMVWDDDQPSAPGVLVSHAWGGRGEFENEKARWLASKGYVGFALDMYGKGVRGSSTEENAALMTPLIENRDVLQQRVATALTAMQSQQVVDSSRCAAIGYCFGGLCVLDLARAGADVSGVVSVHGLLNPPEKSSEKPMLSKVLCLHGYDDPMAPPDSVLAFASEMSGAGVDWQVHAYGNTLHAFTNPAANDPDMGTVYSAVADARATLAIEAFLIEVLA